MEHACLLTPVRELMTNQCTDTTKVQLAEACILQDGYFDWGAQKVETWRTLHNFQAS